MVAAERVGVQRAAVPSRLDRRACFSACSCQNRPDPAAPLERHVGLPSRVIPSRPTQRHHSGAVTSTFS